MSGLKEVAKFACGWEAFHAVLHAYFWCSGLTVTLLGFTATPTVSLVAAPTAALVSVLLGLFAWGRLPPGGNTTNAAHLPKAKG